MEKNRREGLEDLLEAVWLRLEAGKGFCPKLYKPAVCKASVDTLVAELEKSGLLEVDGDEARLTPDGEQHGAQVVRRHRLAERLFHDLLQARVEDSFNFACRFEHILNEEVTEAVCTLLGHPPTCPHGRRIPPGRCCGRSEREVKSLVKPLDDFPPGSNLRIVFITPGVHQRLDRLNSLGILPGAEIQVHQKQPAFVIRIAETEVAVERDIAKEIFGIKTD
ncbi:MAG: metal-dependent transcriptional regulator [bacterium]